MVDVFASVARLPNIVSAAVRPHLAGVALALSGTLLAIYGNDINGCVKAWVKQFPFVIRAVVFILLVAFGYGAAALAISHLVARWLGQVNDPYLALVTLCAFIAAGILAEHKRHI